MTFPPVLLVMTYWYVFPGRIFSGHVSPPDLGKDMKYLLT